MRSDTGSGGSRCAFAAVSWPITRFGGSPRRCIVVRVVTTHASRAHARLLSDIRATGKPVPVVGEGSFVYGAHRARFLLALPCLNLYKWEWKRERERRRRNSNERARFCPLATGTLIKDNSCNGVISDDRGEREEEP